MPKSNTHKLESSSIIKFNIDMHGVKKGSQISYGSADPGLQLLIRRRMADNDGSVEIVKNETKSKPKNKKPTDGKGASKDKKGDN